MPWIGSLGLVKDLEVMFRTACYADPEGHQWNPADKLDWWTAEEVPSSPRCVQCRRLWRRTMQKRGLTETQIRRCFDRIDAKWDWGKKRETPLHLLSPETQILSGVDPIEARRNYEKKRRKAHERKLERKPEPVFTVVSVDAKEWTPWHDEQNALADRAWDDMIERREAGETVEFRATRYWKTEKE